MRSSLLAAALTLLAATAHAAAPACEADATVKPARITARVILVGETHGTEQAPAFVARLVCGLLAQGRPVTLALERSASEQPALDRYLASGGSIEDQRTLLATGDWARDWQDGRSSAAMLGLLEQLRRLRQAGQPVAVLAMVPPVQGQTQTQGEHDKAVADFVASASAAAPGRTFVVYAGSFHTAVGSKELRAMFGTPSTGDLLAEHQPVHVVGLTSSSGTVWVCNQDCGVRTTLGGPWDLADARVDTVVALGPVTASQPARAQAQAPR